MPFEATGRMVWAANSSIPLQEVCERVQSRLCLNPFRIDCEVEDEDWWSYGTSENPANDFNITAIGEYKTPDVWGWMWGAPDKANYQIAVMWDSRGAKPDLALIEREIAAILGCRLVRYPGFDVQ
jgi:hypothetical protein